MPKMVQLAVLPFNDYMLISDPSDVDLEDISNSTESNVPKV